MNVNGDVPDGFIHHWIGAELIPNATVGNVERVLEDYDHYAQIYSPDLKLAAAKKTGPRSYDVRLITERLEGLLHFAFDMHSRVEYRQAADDSLIESRSYLIRESDSGHAPYTDLMPEGSDHGILWRLNSYWRLRQAGNIGVCGMSGDIAFAEAFVRHVQAGEEAGEGVVGVHVEEDCGCKWLAAGSLECPLLYSRGSVAGW